MPARASPSGFTAPYHFSISPTCGFAFGDFHVEYKNYFGKCTFFMRTMRLNS